MIAAFQNLAPTLQALLAGCLTWFLTALGASLVFFTRNASQKLLDWMLGFAAGIMIAASFWSLLAPAIAISKEGDLPIWLPASVGFLLGGGFLRCQRYSLILTSENPSRSLYISNGSKVPLITITEYASSIIFFVIKEGSRHL